VAIAVHGESDSAVPGQGLGHLWVDTAPGKVGDIGVPEAVESWLQLNGFIQVSRDGKVLPYFSPLESH